MNDTEIIEAVRELNSEIYELAGSEYAAFSATFNGTYAFIDFLGNTIWREDEDERGYYDEAEENRETLTDFLRRNSVEEIIDNLQPLAEAWRKYSPAHAE